MTLCKPPVFRESNIEKSVVKYAISKGWLPYKWSSPSVRGVPDRLFFKNGFVLMVEFKSVKNKCTPLQDHVHAKLLAAGFFVHVIKSEEDGRSLIDKLSALDSF